MAEETFVLRDVHGRSVTLSNESGLWVEAHDGLGMPDVARALAVAPATDGAFQTAARWTPRIITLRIANTRHDILSWSLRSYLIGILNQKDELIYLDVGTENGTFRIDVRYHGSLSMPRAAQHDGFDRSVVQLIAEDPTFYLSTAQVANWLLGGAGSPGTAIPMAVPTAVGGGATAIDARVNIVYLGSYLARPIIRLDGPITGPVIENEATGEKLDFTGSSLSAGDYWIIDCRTGYKTVTNKDGDSQISKLTSDSDIATFHIAPVPEAEDGVNPLHLTGSGGGTGTRAAITYYLYFLGI